MTLRIQVGDYVANEEKTIEGDVIRFVTEDGRAMFDVYIGKDGRSIEVGAPQVTKVDGVIYDSKLEVLPRATNRIVIRTSRYDSE